MLLIKHLASCCWGLISLSSSPRDMEETFLSRSFCKLGRRLSIPRVAGGPISVSPGAEHWRRRAAICHILLAR